MGRLNKKKLISVRLPKNVLKGLEEVSKFNNTNRTREIERYLREGLEKSRRVLKKRYAVFSMMILTLASIGLYIWYLFNI